METMQQIETIETTAVAGLNTMSERESSKVINFVKKFGNVGLDFLLRRVSENPEPVRESLDFIMKTTGLLASSTLSDIKGRLLNFQKSSANENVLQ